MLLEKTFAGGGHLNEVSRTRDCHLCAVLNGATKCDWYFDLRKSCEVTEGYSVFPVLVFSRSSVEEEDLAGGALCEWWNKTHASQSIN